MYAEHLLDRELSGLSLPFGMRGRALSAETAFADNDYASRLRLGGVGSLTAGTINRPRSTHGAPTGWELLQRTLRGSTGSLPPRAFDQFASGFSPLVQAFEIWQAATTAFTPASRRTLDRFRDMLNVLCTSVDDNHFRALHKQLTALLDDEQELADASVRPSMASFAGLIQFLQRNKGLKHPGLSLDQQGRFVAVWQPRNRAKISITFKGLTSANWIAIDRSGPEAMRGSGAVSRMAAGTIDERFCGWLLP
jgi:hypothetical protein